MIGILLGVFGVILLATSGIPQIIRSFRTKNVSGLSPYSISCVFFGCLCMSSYTILEEGLSLFHINYIINGVISFINLVLYFRYRK